MNEWSLKARFLRDEVVFLLNVVEHSDVKAYTALNAICWWLQELETVDIANDYDAQKNS